MLAGRNVPAKELTKKIRMTSASGGRSARSIGQSSTIHRYAISVRSTHDERDGQRNPLQIGVNERIEHGTRVAHARARTR